MVIRYIDDVEVRKPKITIGTHFFKINDAQGNIAKAIADYAVRYNQMGFSPTERTPNGKPKYVVKSRFYTYIPLKNEYRFHIEQLNDLLDHFERRYIGPVDIDLVSKEYTDAPECEIKLLPGWELRDYQKDVKAFILNKGSTKSRSRLASLPTGTGKTVIALGTVVDMKCRVGIPVPSSYSEKWVGDVMEQFDIKAEEIILIGAGKKDEKCPCDKISIKKALKLASEGIYYKVYVFSQETLASYYKSYETAWHEEFSDEWGCEPEDLFETLGIGVTIIDETHEAINMVFRMMTYMNVPYNIGLSGTLRSRDPFITDIQRLMYPVEIRYEKVKMNKYIQFIATSYAFANLQRSKIRTMSRGSNMYSQAEYEKSIYANQNKLILMNTLKMLDKYFKEDFVDRKKPGEKCAIYLSRVEFCSIVVKYLKAKYPDMDIRKYTGEDPFENAIESEVRVTTRGSCGTAIDIRGLVSLITFDNVDSDVGNLQLLGRLRENKLTDTVPRFRQLYCSVIPKHVGYQKTRHQTVQDRVLSINYERYGQPLDIPEGAKLDDFV